MALLLKNCSKIIFGKQVIKDCFRKGQQLQSLKTTALFFNPNKQNHNTTRDNESSNDQRKAKDTLKITLIQNQNLTVTLLEDAKNLAKRRAMHLVKVQDLDTKSQRPVYKLLTAAEMLESELADATKSASDGEKPNGASKKSEKSLSISSRIAEHDLHSRLKNISKWLSKQHEIRILIQGTNEKDLANCEKIYKTIEDTIKTQQVMGKIVQKRTKGNIIRFNILPVEAATNDKTAKSSQ